MLNREFQLIMNPSKLKQLLLTILISGLLYSCNNQIELSFDYKVNGDLITTLESPKTPISRTTSNYNRNGKITIDYTLLKKETALETLTKRDSSFFTNTVNGHAPQFYYSITNTKFKCDSVTILKKEGRSRNYSVSGKIESEVMTVKNKVDTLFYTLKGTFNNNVQITSTNKDYSEKMCHYVINKDLLKYYQNEFKKMATETASR